MPWGSARNLALALLFLTACQEEPDRLGIGALGADGVRSGGRLRASFLDDGASARRFLGFHDLARGEDCAFGWNAATAATYCLPAWQASDLYRDAACTQPIVNGAAGGYFAPPVERCAAGAGPHGEVDVVPPRLWEVGDEVAVDAVYSGAGGCAPASGQPTAGWRALVEVPLDDFVAGQVTDEGEGRVLERAIAGEDGARQPIAIRDQDLDTLCTPTVRAGRAGVCTPAAMEALIGVDRSASYADDSCSELLFSVDEACAEIAPGFEIETTFDPDGTATGATVRRRGEPVTPAAVWQTRAGACVGAPDRAAAWFAAGPAIDESALAPVRWELAASSGRLQPYDDVVGDLRTRLGTPWFHDRELDVDCIPAAASDGVVRCLPVPAVAILYLDDTCNTPIKVVETGSSSAPAVATRWYSAYEEVVRVEEALPADSPLFRRTTGGVGQPSCLAAVASDYHRIGDVLPPDDLVELVELTE